MLLKLITLMCTLPLLACSNVPSGPSALVLPAAHTNESQFRTDDTSCRKFAHAQLVTTPHPPQSLEEGQLHFDISYLQCMYGKGHLIPVSGEVLSNQPTDWPTTLPLPASPKDTKP
jgi:hypothetical protein